jgi:cell division protease FtsH
MGQLQMGGDGEGGGIFGSGKSLAKLVVSKVKFSDVAGIKEEKEELIEIVDYLKTPAKYVAMGARVPKGVILYGAPGTGKTLLAKAVAGEAGVPFFQISGSAFEDMLVGVGAKRVRDLFAKAKKSAPSIIFIDEIDSVASKRGSNSMMGAGGGIADQTINQLLAEMDGFSTGSGVVVIAATNRLDVLDEAILRPGRFDRHIQINLPDIKERIEILKIHSKNKNISTNVSLEDIARRTPGFSGAQLENVLNEATLLAVRFNKTAIGMKEIDEAIDRVVAGPAKKSKVISEDEKKQIAYHEAGHALVGLFSPGSDLVEKITIIPRGQAGGYTILNPEKQELLLKKKSDLMSNLKTLMGGRAAEELVFGKDDISTGASNDLYKATNIARSMVMQLGMTNAGITQFVDSEGSRNPYMQKLYSENTAVKIDAEIETILATKYNEAMEIIKKNKKELDLIVETLLVLETIVKPQIDFIHKNLALPDEVIKAKKEFVNTENTEDLATEKPTKASKPKKEKTDTKSKDLKS